MKDKSLTLVRVNSDFTASPIYRVEDARERVIGFVSSKRKKNTVKVWGFALVETEYRSGIPYVYNTRQAAVEALVKMRSLKADTGSIKIIK